MGFFVGTAELLDRIGHLHYHPDHANGADLADAKQPTRVLLMLRAVGPNPQQARTVEGNGSVEART